VSLVIQSFNHRRNIPRIADALRRTGADELIVCEDGSVDGSGKAWRRKLTRPNDFLIESNDLHEIRTYNRAVGLARGEFVGLLQDDDIPPDDPRWVADAVGLFRRHPGLAILGCWNGWTFDFRDFERSTGSPVGPGDSVEAAHAGPFGVRQAGVRFAFVDAVGIGPFFVRRSAFESLGGFDPRLSGPGEPGIWLDYELCLRAWSSGMQVGLFESAAFRRNVGGQGTMMFSGSKRRDNYRANLARVDDAYAEDFSAIRTRIDELNLELARAVGAARGS
jgi:GT2 family glycosyltransferase